jgi:short-subunit dehydrogenase
MAESTRWALVTGAGRGIGKAISLVLAKRGYSLVLASRTVAQLEETAKEARALGSPEVDVHQVDLSDASAVSALAEHCVSAHGGVDALVNNAGVYKAGNAAEGNPDDFDFMLAVNVSAPMRLTRLLSESMAARAKSSGQPGLVLTVGSVAGLEPMQSSGAYAATKWAMRGWSLSSYQRLRYQNIKVCMISPAYVNTHLVPDSDRLLRDRMIQPEDIGQAVKFILECSSGCCPEEINLRLTLSAYKDA